MVTIRPGRDDCYDPPVSQFTCPDCDDPVHFTFMDTAGLGGWKRGDGFNTVPDTSHFVCFSCAKCWKQRQDGPLTPDMIGDIAFFTCRLNECGAAMTVTKGSTVPTEIELTCGKGHAFRIANTDEGGLVVASLLDR